MNEEARDLLLDQHEKELVKLNNRLESVEKWKAESQVTDAKILAELKSLNEKTDKLTKKVEELEAKPAKRWESVIVAIISSIIAFIAGTMLNRG